MENLKEQGFYIEYTGGGCTAWVKKLPTGQYIVITNGNLSHEFSLSDGFELGIYDGSEDECMWGECIEFIEFEGVNE